MAEFSGWLLDLYEGSQSGVVLWFVTPEAERVRLYQDFPVTFYIGGAENELKKAGVFLRSHFPSIQAFFTQRQDLYRQEAIPVLAVKTQPAGDQPPGAARLRSISRAGLLRRRHPRRHPLRGPLRHLPAGALPRRPCGRQPAEYRDIGFPPGILTRRAAPAHPAARPGQRPALQPARDPDGALRRQEQRIPIRYESSSLIRLNTILTITIRTCC